MILLLVLSAALPLVGKMEFVLLDGSQNGWGVIQWPVVAADPSVAEGINMILDYERVTGEPLHETISIFKETGHGITSSRFEVNFMDNEYLDLSITMEFYGAYPSTFVSSYLFNLENGELVRETGLFRPEMMDELVQLCDSLLQENIRRKQEEEGDLFHTDRDHHFSRDDLGSAGMRENGLVFEYSFGYPHVILAAEPSGVIFLTWEELENYVLPGVPRN